MHLLSIELRNIIYSVYMRSCLIIFILSNLSLFELVQLGQASSAAFFILHISPFLQIIIFNFLFKNVIDFLYKATNRERGTYRDIEKRERGNHLLSNLFV